METITGYTLVGMLGSGTSGTVWKAHDDTLDRMVAIKALRAPTAESRAQWRSEAHVLAALDDPHLVAVYGYAETAEGAYIVEEWIDGAPLPAVLTAGPLSTAQALGVIRGALLGLSHVHARGLVHGDIAPGNILLDAQGTSKLVDFGLATHAGAASSSSGTAAYASPEAQLGAPVSAPSDVYAAAAVLAYLLRGRAAATPVLDGIDAALHPVLRRALHHDPAQRYPDAAAFLTALEQDATRRYGPAWWTQTGLAALVATAPAVLLIEGTGSTGTAIAGHGTAATIAGPAPIGADHLAGPVSGATPPTDALQETFGQSAIPPDRIANRRRLRTPRPRVIAIAAAVVVVLAATATYAATRHKTKPIAASSHSPGGTATGVTATSTGSAKASATKASGATKLAHGTAAISYRLVHHCATCRNFPAAGTINLTTPWPESAIYADGSVSASAGDGGPNTLSFSGTGVKLGTYAYERDAVSDATALPSYQMSVLIPLTGSSGGFQNEDASSGSFGSGKANASCNVSMTRADAQGVAGTITCPSVSATLSGGTYEVDIIYALSGTFSFTV